MAPRVVDNPDAAVRRRRGVRPVAGRRAFSLAELLVVMGIMVILLAISVPGLSAVISNSRRAQAENALRASILVARNLAIGSELDTAVVVLYEPGGAVRLVPARQVGQVMDVAVTHEDLELEPAAGMSVTAASNQTLVERDVFIAEPALPVLDMPPGWMVRGWVPPAGLLPGDPAYLEPEWYAFPESDEGGYGGHTGGMPDTNDLRWSGHWVFPEDGFHRSSEQWMIIGDERTGAVDVTSAGDNPRVRSSFMVRFEAGTGRLVTDAPPALFVDQRTRGTDELNLRTRQFPAASGDGDIFDPSPANESWKRIELYEDTAQWVRRVAGARDFERPTTPVTDPIGQGFGDMDDHVARAQVIGARSDDTVLAGCVSRLAIYEEEDLAAGLGMRGVNRETGSIYEPFDPDFGAPRIDQNLFPGGGATAEELPERINWWISGNTFAASLGRYEPFDPQRDPGVGDPDRPRARIFSVMTLGGELREVLR